MTYNQVTPKASVHTRSLKLSSNEHAWSLDGRLLMNSRQFEACVLEKVKLSKFQVYLYNDFISEHLMFRNRKAFIRESIYRQKI